MVGKNELFEVIERFDLHPTEASRLIFGHASRFMSVREHINKYVVTQVLLPDFPMLAARIRPHTKAPEETPEEKVASGVLELKRHAESLEAKLVLWVPPVHAQIPTVLDSLKSAGAKAGVPVLIPVDDAALDLDSYTDGLHLTPQAAVLVSREMGKALLAFTSSAARDLPAPTDL
jgi:hypothetical protein